MTLARREDLGIPGKTSDTGLILRSGLTEGEIAHTLRLIGRISRASPWWAADALVYAEEHLPEGKFSQIAEELGLVPHTMQNYMWVAKAWARSRRREELSFAHHETLAALEDEDQDYWAGKAIAGDTLPNGEKRPWSAKRLREELVSPRKKKAAKETAAPSREAVLTQVDEAGPDRPTGMIVPGKNGGLTLVEAPPPLIAERGHFDVEHVGRCRVQSIAIGVAAVVVTLVRVKE